MQDRGLHDDACPPLSRHAHFEFASVMSRTHVSEPSCLHAHGHACLMLHVLTHHVASRSGRWRSPSALPEGFWMPWQAWKLPWQLPCVSRDDALSRSPPARRTMGQCPHCSFGRPPPLSFRTTRPRQASSQLQPARASMGTTGLTTMTSRLGTPRNRASWTRGVPAGSMTARHPSNPPPSRPSPAPSTTAGLVVPRALRKCHPTMELSSTVRQTPGLVQPTSCQVRSMTAGSLPAQPTPRKAWELGPLPTRGS